MGDPAVAPVMKALAHRSANVLHWDSRHLLNDCAFTLSGGTVDGWLLVDDDAVQLSEITGILNRVSSVELSPEYRSLHPEDPVLAHSSAAASRFLEWCDLADCRVINRPKANDSNSAKAYQAQLIRSVFPIPSTLVTNDPAELSAFLAEHDRIVCKACSGERAIVRELTPSDFVGQSESLRFCPAMFQEYIDGLDVRVHVVGGMTFGTSVESKEDDYRYDPQASWRPFKLSEDLSQACVVLAEAMNLPLAGIDLRLKPNGDVYCFEVNPSPAFSVYEESGARRISAAIADLLISG